jgi:hypothetical protein
VHHLWCWITANAQAITAVAAAIGMLFTALYLIATILIFNETRKSADAAAVAAQAAKDNVLAAQQSARAAQSSAGAASQSAALMHQQLEEQANLGRSIVQTTVDSASAAVDHWKSINIRSLNASQIPNSEDLVPARADSAVEHARRISQEAAAKLSSAFDDLGNARRELDIVRSYSGSRPLGLVYKQICDSFDGYLTSALAKLMDVRKLVP